MALKGKICVVIYNDVGVVDKFIFAAAGDILRFGMTPNTSRSLYAITEDALFVEVKPGHFTPTSESNFAK